MHSNEPNQATAAAIAIVRDEQQRQADPLVRSLLERIINRIANETPTSTMTAVELHELYVLAGERFDKASSEGGKTFWRDLQDQVAEWVESHDDSDPPHAAR